MFLIKIGLLGLSSNDVRNLINPRPLVWEREFEQIDKDILLLAGERTNSLLGDTSKFVFGLAGFVNKPVVFDGVESQLRGILAIRMSMKWKPCKQFSIAFGLLH